MAVDAGVGVTRFLYDLRHCLYGAGLSAPDINIPAYSVFQRDKFCFCFVYHGYDLFGTFSQQHPLRGEDNLMTFSYKKPLTELIFQILDLAGQSRLGQMQKVRGSCDISLTLLGDMETRYLLSLFCGVRI